MPTSTVDLTNEQTQNFHEVARILGEAGDRDGLIAFLVVLEQIQQIIGIHFKQAIYIRVLSKFGYPWQCQYKHWFFSM